MAKHRHGRSSRYAAYTGGPDPLAPPVDLREALEQIGQDVMEGSSPRRALSELMRRGTQNMRGADKLAAEANRRRRELLQRNNLDGTLAEIKKLLDEAVLAERKELARALDDDARFNEMRIESLPPSPAKAVQELSDYDWRSQEAREKYEQIKDLLGREMLDQRFAGMKQALENATDEDRQRVNQMLDDLNELLDKHSRGEDTDQDFKDFMDKHGEFFPENPQNVDELLDSLAQRAAAAQRFRNSLSPDQRAELDALAQQAFGSPSLMNALNRLDGHLQAARPGEDWTGSSRFSGDNPMGMGEGTQAFADIAELEQLAEAGESFTAISEERGEVAFGEPGAPTRIVIDPIDGSLNVRRTIPSHSLSLAVASADSMEAVDFGYVYDFGAGEEFVAHLGGGATLNGEPLRAEPPESDRPLEVVGIEAAKPERMGPVMEALADDVYRLRAVGSLAITMAYVAAARFDGMLGLRPARSVDVAA